MRKIILLFGCWTASLVAQDQDPQNQQWRIHQRAIFGNDYNPTKGITVLPIDSKVLQSLEGISALENQKKFEDAARTYQSIMTEYGTKVLPVKDDPEFFIGVKTWCESKIMGTPELLKAYRLLHDESVQARIDRALENNDKQALRQLAGNFALSSPGRGLLLRLAAMDYENGEFEDALYNLKRCLTIYPASASEVVPLMALSLWRTGNSDGLRDLGEWLKKKDLGGIEVDLGGMKSKLDGLVDSKLKSLPKDWEYTRIGDHFQSHASSVKPGKIRWQYRFGENAAASTPRWPQMQTTENVFMLAAATRKRFVVNTNYKLVALDINNGKVVALREGDKTRYDPQTYVIRTFGEGGEARQNVTFYGVTEKDGVAYCSLFRTMDEQGRGGRQMLLSVRNLEGFEYGQSRSIFSIKDKTLNMLCPPEPIGDSLYLGASHREDTTTPPDNFVMRLDRSTGRVLWQTFLCMNTGKNVPMFGPFNDAPPIVVTYHEGDLYVASNNGCVAVLEAATGHIRWMRSYVQSRTGMMPAPPIVFGDGVIFGGVDLADNSNTGKVVAYDRINGTLQWQRTFKIARDNPTFMEGIADGKLLISGPTIMCLSAKGGKILWKSDVLYSIVGKGALSNEFLYVPSADGIEAYSLADGSHSTVMAWGDDSRLVRGNLMILENGFIAYSDRAVTFFAPQTVPAPVKEKK